MWITLLNHKTSWPHPRVSDSVDLGWGIKPVFLTSFRVMLIAVSPKIMLLKIICVKSPSSKGKGRKAWIIQAGQQVLNYRDVWTDTFQIRKFSKWVLPIIRFSTLQVVINYNKIALNSVFSWLIPLLLASVLLILTIYHFCTLLPFYWCFL